MKDRLLRETGFRVAYAKDSADRAGDMHCSSVYIVSANTLAGARRRTRDHVHRCDEAPILVRGHPDDLDREIKLGAFARSRLKVSTRGDQ